MNTIRMILFVLLCTMMLSAQDKQSLTGEWTVVSVDNGQVYRNNKKDSVATSAEFDRQHTDPVSRQDRIGGFRLNCSHNLFVFTEDSGYGQYMDINKRLPIFLGKFKKEGRSRLLLDVKTRMGYAMHKVGDYYFTGDLLCFRIETLESVDHKPVVFVLERKK